MPAYLAAATAALVALLLLLVTAWLLRQGWTPFSFVGGQTVAFPSPDLARLRFRQARFTVQPPGAPPVSIDVTNVLDGMARAYPAGDGPPALLLGGHGRYPLNPFSFTIPGFNDRAAVPTAAEAAARRNWPVSLTGSTRTF